MYVSIHYLVVALTVCTFVIFFQKIINFLRQASYGAIYATSMSPPVAQMAISAMKIIMGENGNIEGIFLLCVYTLEVYSTFYYNIFVYVGKLRIGALAENTG